MAKQMKTMKEAREKLIEVIGKVESRKMDLGSAKVINNGVGKVISTIRTQLEYTKLRKSNPELNIEFMNCK